MFFTQANINTDWKFPTPTYTIRRLVFPRFNQYDIINNIMNDIKERKQSITLRCDKRKCAQQPRTRHFIVTDPTYNFNFWDSYNCQYLIGGLRYQSSPYLYLYIIFKQPRNVQLVQASMPGGINCVPNLSSCTSQINDIMSYHAFAVYGTLPTCATCVYKKDPGTHPTFASIHRHIGRHIVAFRHDADLRNEHRFCCIIHDPVTTPDTDILNDDDL